MNELLREEDECTIEPRFPGIFRRPKIRFNPKESDNPHYAKYSPQSPVVISYKTIELSQERYKQIISEYLQKDQQNDDIYSYTLPFSTVQSQVTSAQKLRIISLLLSGIIGGGLLTIGSITLMTQIVLGLYLIGLAIPALGISLSCVMALFQGESYDREFTNRKE